MPFPQDSVVPSVVHAVFSKPLRSTQLGLQSAWPEPKGGNSIAS